MKNKEQELLNYFYQLSQVVNKDKCMRLGKEEIFIISKALSLLEETSIDIAKQEYDIYLNKIEEIKNQKSCCECRFYDIKCMFKHRNKVILDAIEVATNCEHYDFGMYNEM